jgi:aryl-alcohol dehydrogenase-like predicted oxidoreductase
MSSPPQVEYRRLGQSGLRVSNPILGAMSLGTSKWAPWVIDEEEVRFAVPSRSRTFVLTLGFIGTTAPGGRMEAWGLVRNRSETSPSATLIALTFGRTWDTANMYSNGESEVLIGKAIKKVRR